MLLLLLFLRIPYQITKFGKELNFTQILDHFDTTNHETFQQRYYFDDSHANPENPRFLVYIGGEADLNPKSVQKGPLFEIAQEAHTYLFALEHRYFGESIPTDTDTENLKKYLTTAQALEDLAYFITKMKSIYCSNYTNCSVLIAGGSYAGTLSSFFRMRYPHLANFSWASSPPLNIKNDFWEYDSHVSKVINHYNSTCRQNAKDIQLYISEQAKENETYQIIHDRLNLGKSTDHVSAVSIVADFFAGIVQYETRNHGIEKFCSTQKSDKYDIEAFYQEFNDSYGGESAEGGDDLLLTNSSRYSEQHNSRSWLWMTCNEFGWYQTSYNFRPDVVNLNYSSRVCNANFGIELANQSDIMRRYGGTFPKVSNIYYVNGKDDPWSALSINQMDEDHSQARFVRYITGGSHCSEMSAESETDSDDLKAARKQVKNQMIEWMTNRCASKCQHGTCQFGQCVCESNEYSGEFCATRIVSKSMFKLFSGIVVALPTLMMIIIGMAAWFLFGREKEEPEIRTIT